MNGMSRFNKLYRNAVAVLLSALVLVCSGCSLSPDTNVSKIEKNAVKINEVCTNNDTVIADSDGDFLNWIELYNPNDEKVYLSGYGLSNDANDLFKYTFNFASIPAKGYLLVYASNKTQSVGGSATTKATTQTTTNNDYYAKTTGALKSNSYVEEDKEYYANLELSALESNSIYLTASDGDIVDQVNIPALEIDTSFGCKPDGSGSLQTLVPTPKATNDKADIKEKEIEIDAPKFSQDSGFYSSSFNLSLSAADPDYTIYYTTDSSIPTDKSKKYTGSISISDASSKPNVYSMIEGAVIEDKIESHSPSYAVDKATVIRAIAYDSEGNRSKVITKTYFVGYGSKSGYSNMSVISLVADPDDLFDKKDGIYMNGSLYDEWLKKEITTPVSYWSIPTNYSQRGKLWEREGHIDCFGTDKSLLFSQNIGVRINGDFESYQQQKSFEIHAEEKYDDTTSLKKSLFNNVSNMSSFILRNGGGSVNTIKLNDVIAQKLVADRSVSTQKSQPTIVFLDGEYWGFYNLRENYDAAYFNAHYGVDEEDVLVYSNGKVTVGNAEDVSMYRDMRSQIVKKDMTVANNYKAACDVMDMQSFIDYCCANVYVANSNWPNNNYALWRSKEVDKDNPYADGKWRWMMYSADATAAASTNNIASANTFSYLFRSSLFSSLIKNETFKQQFILTFMDMINSNFKYSEISGTINSLINSYSAPVAKNSQRFKGGTNWEYNFFADRLKSFYENRSKYITSFLTTSLTIEEKQKNLTVSINDSNAGSVKLNTVTISGKDGSWTGSYFTGYSMTATAKPKKGYVFDRWQVSDSIEILNNINEKTLEFQIREKGDATITAIYKKAQ